MKEQASFLQDWGIFIFDVLAVLGVIALIRKFFISRYYQLVDWRDQISMNRTIEIVRASKSLYYNVRPERVLVCRSHNGTGIPKPGLPIHVTVIDEECGDSKPIIDDWQNRLLTGEARDVISILVDKPFLDVIVENLDVGTAYKGTFIQHGIKVASHYKIRATRSGYYFLILWFTSEYFIGNSESKERITAQVETHLERFKKVL